MAFYNLYDDGNNGIWFREEDPDDELYDPKCCRNVYFDHACGYFDKKDYDDYDDYEDDEDYDD
jgi:hypothetical protein